MDGVPNIRWLRLGNRFQKMVNELLCTDGFGRATTDYWAALGYLVGDKPGVRILMDLGESVKMSWSRVLWWGKEGMSSSR